MNSDITNASKEVEGQSRQTIVKITKDELQRMYTEYGVKYISKQLNITTVKVYETLHQYGIPVRERRVRNKIEVIEDNL